MENFMGVANSPIVEEQENLTKYLWDKLKLIHFGFLTLLFDEI